MHIGTKLFHAFDVIVKCRIWEVAVHWSGFLCISSNKFQSN